MTPVDCECGGEPGVREDVSRANAPGARDPYPWVVECEYCGNLVSASSRDKAITMWCRAQGVSG